MHNLPQLFKELAQYLGAKIDYSNKEIVAAIRNNQLNPTKVELDLTSKAIEKLQDSSQLDIQNILKTLKEVAGENSQDMTRLSSEVAKLVKAVESESSETFLLKTMQNILRQILVSSEKMQKKMESSSDAKEIAKLDEIIRAVKANKIDVPKVDVSELKVISTELKTLNRAAKEDKFKGIETKLDNLAAIMEVIAGKKFDFPKTFKLDDMQVRKISSGGSGVQTRGATGYTTDILTLTNANTEYSYTFPANTVSYTFKLRSAGNNLYYASAANQTPANGTDYITLLPGLTARSQDNVEWSNKTIYFESDGAGNVVEIEIFTM